MPDTDDDKTIDEILLLLAKAFGVSAEEVMHAVSTAKALVEAQHATKH